MEQLKTIFRGRPIWMNVLMVFCAYMTFIYMPFDMFIKPVAEDEEVWFGYMLTGWAAKATEPIHWAIYGFGFYGFLKMKSWMFPWASLYVFQVAIAMGVWGYLYGSGSIVGSIVVGAVFAVLGVMLWLAKPQFSGLAAESGEISEVEDPAPATENPETETQGNN